MKCCPVHGYNCHRLCRFWKQVRALARLPEPRPTRVRVVETRITSILEPPPATPSLCPIHRFRRHPRICRFCRADTRVDAPPLAPSEAETAHTEAAQ